VLESVHIALFRAVTFVAPDTVLGMTAAFPLLDDPRRSCPVATDAGLALRTKRHRASGGSLLSCDWRLVTLSKRGSREEQSAKEQPQQVGSHCESHYEIDCNGVRTQHRNWLPGKRYFQWPLRLIRGHSSYAIKLIGWPRLPRKALDGSDSQTNRITEEQFAAWDRIWREFQKDLAKRSTHGEFWLAEKSGHFIQSDQPELVIQAIRDVEPASLISECDLVP
jgi:hypothetical protein